MMLEGRLTQNPIAHGVAAVSVGVVEKRTLLDLCYTEDAAAAVDLNLVMNSAGEFIELQGTGEEATFSESQLAEMLHLGKTGIERLLRLQHNALSVA
jgi:ribonuclease PH